MKTERMTLLVTPAEKALIAERAAAMNISASEFVRKAVTYLDPEDLRTLEELEALMPEFNAAIGRMQTNVAAAIEAQDAHERNFAWLRSDEYRDQVRREVAEDGSIDWEWTRAVFGGLPDAGGRRTEQGGLAA